jgi:hypothetical protein
MNLISIFFALAATATVLPQSEAANDFKLDARRGANTATVTFQTKPFQPSSHKALVTGKGVTMIDGRYAFGTDGTLPQTEIASMKLYINGNEISVPSRLYLDCYQPNLAAPYINVKFGNNSHIVVVSMHGGDGAAGYNVTWRLRKNGRHSRSIYNIFPDR